MAWRIEWTPESEEWIRNLPSNLKKWAADSFQPALDHYAQVGCDFARGEAANFDGDLSRSINVLKKSRLKKIGPKYAHGAVVAEAGWGVYPDKTLVDPTDVVSAPQPFSYAKAKYYGAKPHVVMLYNPGTGRSTKNRSKLVRQLKSRGGKYSQLPDAPTKETFEAHKDDPNYPSPYVYVNPGEGHDYLTFGMDLDLFLDHIVDDALPALLQKWEE